MWRSRPTIPEISFFVCGILIVLVGWGADFLGAFETGSPAGGHGSATTFPLRVFMTMFGVAFASIGIGFENFPRILQDAETAKRFIVALLFLADGSLHLYAFTDHLNDPFAATFFAVVSLGQIAVAVAIPYLHPRLDLSWLAFTGFLILAYVATRTIVVWPIGTIEEVDPLGLVSKLVEVLTVLVLWSLWRTARAARAGPAPGAAAADR